MVGDLSELAVCVFDSGMVQSPFKFRGTGDDMYNDQRITSANRHIIFTAIMSI
jgi:hypothetical protein